MSLEYLTFDLNYDINTGNFTTGGNVIEEGRRELIENFLRGQIGAGKDSSKPLDQDIYKLQLKWYPENDRIVVKDNTGNKSLRDGILIQYLKTLKE